MRWILWKNHQIDKKGGPLWNMWGLVRLGTMWGHPLNGLLTLLCVWEDAGPQYRRPGAQNGLVDLGLLSLVLGLSLIEVLDKLSMSKSLISVSLLITHSFSIFILFFFWLKLIVTLTGLTCNCRSVGITYFLCDESTANFIIYFNVISVFNTFSHILITQQVSYHNAPAVHVHQSKSQWGQSEEDPITLWSNFFHFEPFWCFQLHQGPARRSTGVRRWAP